MIPMKQSPDNYQMAIGHALLANGGTRSGHPVADAVSQAGTQLLGAYISKLGYDRADERRAAANKTLADALAGAKDVKPWVNPDTGELMSGTSPNDYLAQALMGNEDTAGMGMQFAMNSLNQRSQSALDSAKYDRERKDKIDFYRMTRNDEVADEQAKPLSSLAQLHADYKAGRIPEDVYRDAVTKQTTSQPLVSMGPSETEEAKVIGKGYGGRYNALLEQGEAARRNMSTLADIEPLIDQVSTGTGAGAGLAVKSFLKRVNIDPASIGLADDVAPGEAFRSLSNQLTLMLRSSEGMPASGFSDADRQFLEAIPPNIGNTPEGNKLLARLLRKKFQRTQERAWKAQNYLDEKGTFKGFEVQNPAEPIWGEDDLQELIEVSQSINPPPQQFGPEVPEFNAPAPKADALTKPGAPDEDALGKYLRDNGLGPW